MGFKGLRENETPAAVLQGDIDARAGVVGRLLVSTSALENILPSRKEREKDGHPVPAGHGGGCPHVIQASIAGPIRPLWKWNP